MFRCATATFSWRRSFYIRRIRHYRHSVQNHHRCSTRAAQFVIVIVVVLFSCSSWATEMMMTMMSSVQSRLWLIDFRTFDGVYKMRSCLHIVDVCYPAISVSVNENKTEMCPLICCLMILCQYCALTAGEIKRRPTPNSVEMKNVEDLFQM